MGMTEYWQSQLNKKIKVDFITIKLSKALARGLDSKSCNFFSKVMWTTDINI